MNLRQKHILNTLIVEKEIDLQDTAKKFHVGLRMIRYDLEGINEYARSKIKETIITIKNGTAFLDIDQEKLEMLGVEEIGNDFYELKISPEDRINLMLYDLCWADRLVTIQELADRYFVSRATVNGDLIVMKKWCKDHGVNLVSVKGKGIYIDATENKRRDYLTKIIRSSKETDYQKNFILTEWFKDIDVSLIQEIIIEAERKFELWLTDISFEGLSIHICLAIKRHQDHTDGTLEAPPQERMEKFHYEMAAYIVKEINRRFSMKLPEVEIAYVAIHLEGKSAYLEESETTNHSFIEYHAINMITNIGNRLGLQLRSDQKLLNGLIQHLRASLYRYHNDMDVINPLKEQLMESYPTLYQYLSEYIQEQTESSIIKNSEDEITYVLLHFAAAINRQKKVSKEVANVLVVCATGVGTSELVASALQMHFKLNIKAKIARHQLEHYLQTYAIDLIITTVFLDTVIPTVQVHPILDEQDFNAIRSSLVNLGFDVIPYVENTYLHEFMRCMEAYEHHGDEQLVLREVTAIYQKVKEEHLGSKEGNGDYKMLSELLKEKTIQLDVDCADWQASIKACGALLYEEGFIEETYIEASINSVKEHGPYIVITKGVALAHASSSEGVIKTGMSLVRLKNSVPFGNKNNDPVSIVFMLATMDASSHLVALSDLAEFLEREEFKQLLNEAKDMNEIVTYIKEHETGKEGA